jgi:predicted DNA-binding transcriptional regulator AlpA
VTTALVPDPATEPTMQVDTVAKALGLSRAAAYNGVQTGEIPSSGSVAASSSPQLRYAACCNWMAVQTADARG